MKYKIVEAKKAGAKTEVAPGLFSKQYDDSLTLEIVMDKEPQAIYPSDVLPSIIYNGVRYFFGSSTKVGSTRRYIATYWKNKPVW